MFWDLFFSFNLTSFFGFSIRAFRAGPFLAGTSSLQEPAKLLWGNLQAPEVDWAATARLLQRRMPIQPLVHEAAKQGLVPVSASIHSSRHHSHALLLSEARSLALKGELATASDRISGLDSEVAQLRLALTIANASVASSAVLCSLALG